MLQGSPVGHEGRIECLLVVEKYEPGGIQIGGKSLWKNNPTDKLNNKIQKNMCSKKMFGFSDIFLGYI